MKTAKTMFIGLLSGLLLASLGLDVLAESTSSTIVKPKTYKPKPLSPLASKGKDLFEKNNCSVCHTVSGDGGCLAPPLDGIGSRRSQKFIKMRITSGISEENKFAELYGKTELMPHVRVPAATAEAISQYLLTLKEPEHGFKIIGHQDISDGSRISTSPTTADDRAIARGRALLSSKGCLACHSFGSLGGTFAVKFDGVGKRLTADAIKKQLTKAQLLTLENDNEYGARGTTMPPLDLTEEEISDLTAYLSSLK
jgi:mono/diheme cytochrome c family protein